MRKIHNPPTIMQNDSEFILYIAQWLSNEEQLESFDDIEKGVEVPGVRDGVVAPEWFNFSIGV